jgi:hypothetical protein
MKTKNIILVCLLLLAYFPIYAQGEGGLGFRVMIPTGTFRQNSDAWGIGGGLQALFKIGGNESAVMLGGEISYTMYGHSTRKFSVPIARVGWTTYSRNYELAINNNMFMGHIMARIKPQHSGNVHPYADGLFGFNLLYTNASLKDLTQNANSNNNNTTNTTETNNQLSDIVLSYGGAVGIQFGGDAIKFDVKCYYLFGGNAQYYDASSVSYSVDNAGIVNANFKEPKQSKTDVIIPQIGVIILF